MLINHVLEGAAMLGMLIVMVVLSRTVIRYVPVLAECRKYNLAEDRKRMAKDKYPPVVKKNEQVGLLMFVPLVLLVTPFFTTFSALPWWKYLTDILAVYFVYDFMYYLTHRFLFHGNSYFKRVHGLHHQARNPSHIDAQYVHPLETFLGLLLLYIAVISVGLVLGEFNVVSMAVCFFFYSQLNILNHADVQIKGFPFALATWISKKHHNHHIDMSHGNYATIVLLYDMVFGTFE